MLSLRCALPHLPMVAALSANHLAALALPSGLRRIYIARDNDNAGCRAAATLSGRAEASGIEALTLTPMADDFNADLRLFGRDVSASSLRAQLAPEDVAPFLRRSPTAVSLAEPVRVRSRPGWTPRGGLREGDRAGNGAAPQRPRGFF